MSVSALGWLQHQVGFDVTGEWSQCIYFNVAGTPFTCLRRTLLGIDKQSTFFQDILNGKSRKTDDGAFVIDRDAKSFRHVLNFIRAGRLILPDRFDEWELLLEDSRFYQIKPLEDAILSSFEYQQRCFRKSLPQAVCLKWADQTDRASLTPSVPALQPGVDGCKMLYQTTLLQSVDEVVATLLSSYGYTIQHWKQDGSGATVFLSLSSL